MKTVARRCGSVSVGKAAAKIADHLKRRVQGSGGQYRAARWIGRKGCPDAFIWWEWPRAAYVEIKAEESKDRYSVLQQREVGRMRAAGIPVFTARTLADVDELVEIVRKGGCNPPLHLI